MVASDRQRIIETNRSIRLIRNELESLLERGVLTEAVFDSISHQLPTESGLSRTGSPLPPASSSSSSSSSSSAAPPSYNQSTTATGRPVLARARALYAYTALDARDVSLARDDAVAVLEHMNADWWLGRNERNGREGIFPRAYVEVVAPPPPPPPPRAHGEYYADDKAPAAAAVYPPPPAAGPANPYGAPVPPMAVAEQGAQQQQQQQQQDTGGKVGKTANKLGKKLGNAAIFGAGATMGSNIVNSIF